MKYCKIYIRKRSSLTTPNRAHIYFYKHTRRLFLDNTGYFYLNKLIYDETIKVLEKEIIGY